MPQSFRQKIAADRAYLLAVLVVVIVQHNQISVCYIESRQMFHSCLSIIYVLVHHICCASCFLV